MIPSNYIPSCQTVMTLRVSLGLSTYLLDTQVLNQLATMGFKLPGLTVDLRETLLVAELIILYI